MPFLRANNLAVKNRAFLATFANRNATPKLLKRRARAERKFKDKKRAVRRAHGRHAARALEQENQRLIDIVNGDTIPNRAEAIHILKKLISGLPDDFHGYTRSELRALAPVLVLITQIEGKGDYYVLTDIDLKMFLKKVSENGWNGGSFPQPTSVLPEVPVHSKLKYGVCKHDLPMSEARKLQERKDQQATLARGQPWVAPVFHQDKAWRLQGANIYVHMNCRQTLPSFEIKDEKRSMVAERDVQPDHDDETVFIDLVIARDTAENRRTITGNTDILVRACQYIIYARRHPGRVTDEQAVTAPADPPTFESLKMYQPHYQVDILTRFVARLNTALDDLDAGAQLHQNRFMNEAVPRSTRNLLGKLIDGF
ncbi:hypothetical protein VTL71DRAFT_14747 [Oculimacula yallundae]|uniref:Uncharacterized protein n=1 Tax=Oculimacula yallundae TaxID=86028 RepID=A0ABR4CKP1_9HELO